MVTISEEIARSEEMFCRPENSFNSCSIVNGISDHCGVLLEVEWEENCGEPHVERLDLMYRQTNVLGLQNFIRDKLATLVSNCSCAEEIWNNFKEIVFESVKCFVTHKILNKSSDPE